MKTFDMNRKKILFISHALNSSGAPKALLELIKNKPDYLNCEVYLLGLRFNKLENEFKNYVDNIYIITPHPSSNPLKDFMQRILAIPKIIVYLLHIKPDIIIINSAANSRALIVSKFFKKFVNYRIILYVHEYGETFKAFKFLRKKTICLADKLLVVNNNQREWIKKELKCNKNIFVVPNGINKEEVNLLTSENPEDSFLSFVKNKFVISTVGILTKIKGYDLLLNIIKTLKNQENMVFVIIGDFFNTKDKQGFTSDLYRYELDRKVYITGITSNIFKYLKYSSCIAITSRSETFSRVALEGMLIGIPIVAFNIRGLRETLPSEYPYLVSPFDIQEFSIRILEIYNLSIEQKEHLKEILKGHSVKFDICKISKIFWEEILK